tara:strand:- start:7413 stop:7643 length:231 start_codon:yes stop_codon:yes gene_type:complete
MANLDHIFGDMDEQLNNLYPTGAKYKIVGGERRFGKGIAYQVLTKAWSLEEAKRLVSVWKLHYGDNWHVTYYNCED